MVGYAGHPCLFLNAHSSFRRVNLVHRLLLIFLAISVLCSSFDRPIAADEDCFLFICICFIHTPLFLFISQCLAPFNYVPYRCPRIEINHINTCGQAGFAYIDILSERSDAVYLSP